LTSKKEEIEVINRQELEKLPNKSYFFEASDEEKKNYSYSLNKF
jgi:hypothetical protein